MSDTIYIALKSFSYYEKGTENQIGVSIGDRPDLSTFDESVLKYLISEKRLVDEKELDKSFVAGITAEKKAPLEDFPMTNLPASHSINSTAELSMFVGSQAQVTASPLDELDVPESVPLMDNAETKKEKVEETIVNADINTTPESENIGSVSPASNPLDVVTPAVNPLAADTGSTRAKGKVPTKIVSE